MIAVASRPRVALKTKWPVRGPSVCALLCLPQAGALAVPVPVRVEQSRAVHAPTHVVALPSIHTTTTLTLLGLPDSRARCSSILCAFLRLASFEPLTPDLPRCRPPRRRSSHHAIPPSKTAPTLVSPVHARVPHATIPLRRRNAPSRSRIGVHRPSALAASLLTAKQAFLCHHQPRPVKRPTPLRTPARCRPFQPSGAIQQPSRHATQARRRFRHLNPSPPTTTSNADVIA